MKRNKGGRDVLMVAAPLEIRPLTRASDLCRHTQGVVHEDASLTDTQF